MNHVELQPAYHWECPACGCDNFGIASDHRLEPEYFDALKEEELKQLAEDYKDHACILDYVAEEGDTTESQDGFSTPFIINRVSLLPRFVTCANCQAKYVSMVRTAEDD